MQSDLSQGLKTLSLQGLIKNKNTIFGSVGLKGMEAPVLMSLCEELESGQNISRLILGQFIYSLYLTYFNLLAFCCKSLYVFGFNLNLSF